MLKWGVRIIVPALVWAVLIYFLSRALDRLPGPDEWRAYLNSKTLIAVLGFAACFALATILRTLRFGFLVRRSADISWVSIFLAFPWLFFLGAITPFRLGEGYRAVWIRKHGGTSSEALGFWFGERFTDLAVLTTLFLAGTLLAPLAGEVVSTNLVYVILGLCAFGYAILWFAHGLIADLMERLGFVPRALITLMRSFSYMKDFVAHGSILSLTLAIWAVVSLGFWFVLLLLGSNSALGLGAALAAMGAVNFTALLSAAPANVGSYQAAMVGALALYGTGTAEGLILAILVQAVGLLTTIVMGVGCKVASMLTGK